MIQQATYNPNLDRFSRATFWDTDILNIDWSRHADFVIERVFGYGTPEEQDYVLDIYGASRLRKFAEAFIPNAFNRSVTTNLQKALSHASL